MLRRMCVSLAALAIAAAPALTLLATSGTAEAAPATATAHAAAAHAAIRNGGVDVHYGKPGSKPMRTHGGLFNSTSTNWSGYAASGGPYTTVSATWVQPAGSCSPASSWPA